MNRHIDAAWLTFEQMVLPKDASAIPRTETRKAFFSGASVLYTILTQGVSGGLVPSDSDMALMDAIDAEVREFGSQLDAAVLPNLAPR